MSKRIRSIREMNSQKSLELVMRKRVQATGELWNAYDTGQMSWGETQIEANEQGLNLWA